MGRAVESFATFVHARDHLVEERLALRWIIDGGELIAVAELHGTFESHAAELSRRPRDREVRSLEAATRHRLRAQAVSLAQNDREERHADVGADDEHPAGVTHERSLFDFGADHDAGRVA